MVARAALSTMLIPSSHIPGYLQRIAEVNNGVQYLGTAGLLPFVVGGSPVGHVKKE